MKPMLYASSLTGTIFVATRYSRKGNLFTAHTKYDVTDDFIRVMKRIQEPDWQFEYTPHEAEERWVVTSS